LSPVASSMDSSNGACMEGKGCIGKVGAMVRAFGWSCHSVDSRRVLELLRLRRCEESERRRKGNMSKEEVGEGAIQAQVGRHRRRGAECYA
jgi:hypothetical protein